MTQDIYSVIAKDFNTLDSDLADKLRDVFSSKKKKTPFLDYQMNQEKQKQPELKMWTGQETNPVSDTATAAYTPQLAKKADSDRIKTLLHTETGLAASQWERLDENIKKSVLGKDEQVRPAAQIVGGQRVPGERVTAFKLEEDLRNQTSRYQEWNKKAIETVNPVLFKVKGYEIRPSDIASVALLAYGGYQALTGVAQPLFNRQAAKVGFQQAANAKGTTLNSDELEGLVNFTQYNVKPNNLTKTGLEMIGKNLKMALQGQAGHGPLVPFEGELPKVSPEIAQAAEQAGQKLIAGGAGLSQAASQMPGQGTTKQIPLETPKSKIDNEIREILSNPSTAKANLEMELSNLNTELQARSAPYHAGLKNRNFPNVSVTELNTRASKYQDALNGLEAAPQAPKSITEATSGGNGNTPPLQPAPSVPSSTQPPQPFKGVVISSMPELQYRAWSQTKTGKTGRLLNVRGVKQVARIVNPIAQSNEAGTTLAAMAGMIDDEINGGVVLAMSPSVRDFNKIRDAFVLDRQGVSKALNIKQIKPLPNGTQSMSIHDMIEYAPWYDFGTGPVGDARRKAIDSIRNTSQQLSQMLRDEGILIDDPLKKLEPGQIRTLQGESGWQFLHRVVTEIKEENADTLARNLVKTLKAENIYFPKVQGESNYQYVSRFAQEVSTGTISASTTINSLLSDFGNLADVKVKKQALDAKRTWKTVAEGMSSGVTYESDPLQELRKQARASYELVKKKRLAEAVTEMIQTTTPSESALAKAGETADEYNRIKTELKAAKVFKTALNRTLRGERLHPSTTAALGRVLPGETQQLNALVLSLNPSNPAQKPMMDTDAEVQALTARIEEIINANQGRVREVERLTRTESERMGAFGTEEYGKVPGVPGLGNRVIVSQEGKMGQEIADEIRQHFGYLPKSGADKALEAVGKVGAVMRMFRLGYDLSATTIQQAMSIGYDIKNLISLRPSAVWAKATAGSVTAGFSKDLTHLEKFLDDNSDIVKDFVQRGGLVETAESTEGTLPLTELAKKLPEGKISGIVNFIGKHVLTRSDAVFTTARVMAGVNMYKAGYNNALRNGKLDEWARACNKMTGVLSTRAMGVSAGQRSIEGALVFLSPRFTRANTAILYDIATNPGGYTTKEALKSLAALVGAVAAVYFAVNKIQGEDVTLNPFDRSFGKMKIGNHTYQVGGIMSDIRRGLAVIDSVVYHATGEHVSLSGKEDKTLPLDKLIFQQFQSKTSPITGTGIDVVKMMTDKDARNWNNELITWRGIIDSWISPSWTDPILNEASPGAAAAEIFGLSSNEIDKAYELSLKWRGDFKTYEAIPTDPIEVKAQKSITREKYRERNPEIDAKLFIAGQVTSIKTAAAAGIVRRIIQENGIDPVTITSVKKWQDEQKKREEMGVRDTSVTDTDRLMKSLLASSQATTAKVVNEQDTLTAWNNIASEGGKNALVALNKVWYNGGSFTPEEDTLIRNLFNKYPMGQTNFNTWYKQTLRQVFENLVNEGKIK